MRTFLWYPPPLKKKKKKTLVCPCSKLYFSSNKKMIYLIYIFNLHLMCTHVRFEIILSKGKLRLNSVVTCMVLFFTRSHYRR